MLINFDYRYVSKTEDCIKENKNVRKKERKHALDQEKKKVFSFFLVALLVERVFSLFFFLGRFLGRKRVFLLSCFLL